MLTRTCTCCERDLVQSLNPKDWCGLVARGRFICRPCVRTAAFIAKVGLFRRKSRAPLTEAQKRKINSVNAAARNKRKKASEPLFHLKYNIRNRLYAAFKRGGKGQKTEVLLGADFETVKSYIESLFQIGMSWENYGDWHLDHISPLGLASNEAELINLCHYKNLQPLWKFDHAVKTKNDIRKIKATRINRMRNACVSINRPLSQS